MSVCVSIHVAIVNLQLACNMCWENLENAYVSEREWSLRETRGPRVTRVRKR